jgi:hypothetical protein
LESPRGVCLIGSIALLPAAFYNLRSATPCVDLYLECARECGVDGGDVALPLAAGWFSLAVDSQLGRAHCHQHVALSVFGVDLMYRSLDPEKLSTPSGRSVEESTRDFLTPASAKSATNC